MSSRTNSAAASVSLLVLLQLVSRVLNFGLNAALARGLGPEWYALANVQLQLVSASALFLSREGLRRACQRVYPGGDGPTLAHGANLAWLSVPLAAIAALVAGLYFAREASAAALVPAAEYAEAVWAICAAAVLEACADPGWLYAQTNGLIGRRVFAEGGALAVKTAATAYLALHLRLGARAFGYAQLLYAATYVGLLYAALVRRCTLSQLFPRCAVPAPPRATATEGDHASSAACWLPAGHRAAAASYCWQSAQKYVLTEGERLVLVRLAPLEDQGVFALVSNLGSLVARLVLQPLEEVTFASYSAAAAAGPLELAALARLHALLRGACIFGLAFVSFGPAYSRLLLHLLYGEAWSAGTAAPRLLAAYCAHVCAMAINGAPAALTFALCFVCPAQPTT